MSDPEKTEEKRKHHHRHHRSTHEQGPSSDPPEAPEQGTSQKPGPSQKKGHSKTALDHISEKPTNMKILSPWEKKMQDEAEAKEKAAKALQMMTPKRQQKWMNAAGKSKPPSKPVVNEDNLTPEERAAAYLNEIENVYARRNPDKIKLLKSKHARVRRHPRGPPPSPRIVSRPSKSHKAVAEVSSSSDEEWTHIPYSELRDYVSQAPEEMKKPRPPPVTGEYVDLEIIADPKEPGIRGWVETYTHRLYIYWILMITISCLLAAICMYMFQFLKRVYSQEILVDMFWLSNYANAVSVVFCSMLTAFLGIFFLCYPSPQVWRSMKTTRWVVITMPQIVLLIAHVDQLRILATMPIIEKQLQSKMEADLRFSTSGNILITSTQNYFQCCGVLSYKDWEKVKDFQFEGYPQTCCNGKFFMGCEIPMTKKDLIINVPHLTKSDAKEKPQDQIYLSGCYYPERTMLRALVGIVTGITLFITYSSFAATLLMWNVIGHTNIHSVVTYHPFIE